MLHIDKWSTKSVYFLCADMIVYRHIIIKVVVSMKVKICHFFPHNLKIIIIRYEIIHRKRRQMVNNGIYVCRYVTYVHQMDLLNGVLCWSAW